MSASTSTNPRNPIPLPLTQTQVLDRYFLEHRAKLLDLAAFLDRVQRAQPAQTNTPEDPRLAALRDAAAVLHDGQSRRAQRILDRWSDPTETPLNAAPDTPVTGVPSAAAPDPRP